MEPGICIVACSQCGQKYALPSEAAGTKKKCRICSNPIRVPREPILLQLKRYIRRLKRFRRWVRPALAAIAIAGLCLTVCCLVPPSGESVRRSVCEAHFGNATRDQISFRTTYIDEVGEQYSAMVAYADDGRFVRSSCESHTASGFDGSDVWSRDINGVSRRLFGSSRDHTLVGFWLPMALWSKPEAPFVVTRNLSKSTSKEYVVEVAHCGSDLVATVCVDARTHRVQSTEFAGEKFIVKSYVSSEFGLLPTSADYLDSGQPDGALISATVDESVSESFEKLPSVSVVHFDPDQPSRLQVGLGRHSRLFVRPKINGQDVGWFVFDTGAYRTSINEEVRRQLDLADIGGTRGIGIAGVSHGRRHKIESIELGPVRMESIEVRSTRDFNLLRKYNGVIGCDLLGQCVIEYELRERRIELFDPATYQLRAELWRPLIVEGNTPHIPVAFHGQRGTEHRFLIDTGASGGIHFFGHLVDRLFSKQSGYLQKIRGFGGETARLDNYIKWIELGDVRVTNVSAGFELEAEDFPADHSAGIVGVEALQDMVIVLDIPNERMAVVNDLSYTDRHPLP